VTRAAVELSVVLPVYNEADNIPILWDELAAVLPRVTGSAEVIFVDDGSTDGSADIVEGLAKTDPRIRVIRFEANAGPRPARGVDGQRPAERSPRYPAPAGASG